MPVKFRMVCPRFQTEGRMHSARNGQNLTAITQTNEEFMPQSAQTQTHYPRGERWQWATNVISKSFAPKRLEFGFGLDEVQLQAHNSFFFSKNKRNLNTMEIIYALGRISYVYPQSSQRTNSAKKNIENSTDKTKWEEFLINEILQKRNARRTAFPLTTNLSKTLRKSKTSKRELYLRKRCYSSHTPTYELYLYSGLNKVRSLA